MIAENRLGHAYLFVGPARVGKTQTALAVAKLLNCETTRKDLKGPFCSKCPACARIDKGSYPDVCLFDAITKKEDDEGMVRSKMRSEKHEYRETEKEEDKSKNREIRLSQIHYLSSQVQLRPFEATKKIFIIKNIEDLNQEAGNAILKTLEEPTASSLLLLTTAFPEKILDTVKSRCHVLQFFPESSETLEGRLIKNYKMDKTTAHFLSHFAEGCLGKALWFHNQDVFMRKNAVIDNFVLSGNSEPYFKALIADKEKTKEALDIIYSWFRDLILLKSGIDEIKLIHTDRAKDLKKLEGKYSFEELADCVQEITKTTRLLEDNMNLKIALTLMKEKLWRR